MRNKKYYVNPNLITFKLFKVTFIIVVLKKEVGKRQFMLTNKHSQYSFSYTYTNCRGN